MGSQIVPFMRLSREAELALLNPGAPSSIPNLASPPFTIQELLQGIEVGLLASVGESIPDLADLAALVGPAATRVAGAGVAVGIALGSASEKFAGSVASSVEKQGSAWSSDPIGQLQKVLRDFSFEEIA